MKPLSCLLTAAFSQSADGFTESALRAYGSCSATGQRSSRSLSLLRSQSLRGISLQSWRFSPQGTDLGLGFHTPESRRRKAIASAFLLCFFTALLGCTVQSSASRFSAALPDIAPALLLQTFPPVRSQFQLVLVY